MRCRTLNNININAFKSARDLTILWELRNKSLVELN
jgi:hypothetical protein